MCEKGKSLFVKAEKKWLRLGDALKFLKTFYLQYVGPSLSFIICSHSNSTVFCDIIVISCALYVWSARKTVKTTGGIGEELDEEVSGKSLDTGSARR